MSRHRLHNSRGFSLIEVLVSLSIFTIVVTIGISALYTLIDANARTRNAQSIATNLAFTLDAMTREIRTGSYYYCDSDSVNNLGKLDTNDCPVNGGTFFSIWEAGTSQTAGLASRRIDYRWREEGERGILERRLANTDWEAQTAEDIDIEELRFYAAGTSRTDVVHPMVTIFIRGTVGDEGSNRSNFNIQTTITQKETDLFCEGANC